MAFNISTKEELAALGDPDEHGASSRLGPGVAPNEAPDRHSAAMRSLVDRASAKDIGSGVDEAEPSAASE